VAYPTTVTPRAYLGSCWGVREGVGLRGAAGPGRGVRRGLV